MAWRIQLKNFFKLNSDGLADSAQIFFLIEEVLYEKAQNIATIQTTLQLWIQLKFETGGTPPRGSYHSKNSKFPVRHYQATDA